jgi:hypothetical protein
MTAPQIIRKISAPRIVGNVKAYAPRQGADGSLPKDVVPLYRVFGSGADVRTGNSDNGPFVALKGRFEAVSLVADPETGEVSGQVFVAPECFLPEPTHSILVAELTQKDADGKRVVSSLDFAFEVGVKAAKNPVGYEYVCVPLMEHTGSDPLAALRSKVASLPSVLPGASKAPALENKSAAGKKK